MSAFDKIYRSALPMKFFSKGWGKPETLLKLIDNMKTVTDRKKFLRLVKHDTDIIIEKRTENKRVIQFEGSFNSPFDKAIPNVLFDQNKVAKFQMILPRIWPTEHRAVCIHFAGTGDHVGRWLPNLLNQTYSRRRLFLANQLIEDGIASIIIMNPFYWKRKPEDQRGSSLNYVCDLFVMGGALITECNVLLNWCELNGYGPLALHGISMGGYMATLCATVWPKPISLVPCLSWTSASVVFVEGILSNAVDWGVLTKQYFSDSVYSTQIRQKIQPSVPVHYQVDLTADKCNNGHKSDLPSAITNSPTNTDVPLYQTNKQLNHNSQTNMLGSLFSFLSPSSSFNSPNSNVQVINQSSSMSQSNGNSETNFHKQFNSDKQISLSITNTLTDQRKSDLYSFLFSKQLVPQTFASLKKSHFSNALSSAWRYPLDGSLWHSGISFIRSIPDSLTTASSNADPEVKQFLRELLDYFTHLGNFSPIVDSRLVYVVTAEYDAYVPRQGVCPLNKIYPELELRLLPQSGHVGAYLRNALWTRDFRQAITDCLNHQVELCYHEPGPFGSKPSSPRTNRRRY